MGRYDVEGGNKLELQLEGVILHVVCLLGWLNVWHGFVNRPKVRNKIILKMSTFWLYEKQKNRKKILNWNFFIFWCNKFFRKQLQ